TRVERFYPNWIFLGENVASMSQNEDEVIGVFQRSPEHNSNLLDSRAIAIGSNYLNGYWTQDFGNEWPLNTSAKVTCPTIPPNSQTWSGRLKTKTEGLCLDGSAGYGYALRINTCSQSNLGQLFTISPADTSKGTFKLYFPFLDACVDVWGWNTTLGSTVGLWTCNGNANQQFFLNSDGSISPAFDGLCFDIPYNMVHPPGVMVGQWTCNGGANQKFVKALTV
ncbi:hypothetical protein HDU76_000183, partial [Blyttiomyces sp. JEL0837]